MHETFALIHTWPTLRNAEYEVLQRILKAASNVEKQVVLVDNSGIVLWSSAGTPLQKGAPLPPDVVDFVLSLHFESPRVVDEYSYYALWQPISFYHDFGYHRSIDRFSSHNDLLSCAADLADAHALNIYTALNRPPLRPLPTLFHSLPEPFLEPRVCDSSRLFYIGINWERIGKPKGRFHDALVTLDKRDLIDIYGPEKMMGVAPWEGFKTYRGELPFDGKSVKAAINRAGICLALSSAPHKHTGIMSNRLFEGLAGGAAIIATPNPLIDKFFRDVVYLVDDREGDTALAQQIVEAMREIRADPAEAVRRTRLGQQVLREQCSLERSIDGIFQDHAGRQEHFDRLFLTDVDLTVILIHATGTIASLVDRIERVRIQKRATIDLHILCPEHMLRSDPLRTAISAGAAIQHVYTHPIAVDPSPSNYDGIASTPQRTGPIIAKILRTVTTAHFSLLENEDVIFKDHYASLARAIGAEAGAQMACSGMIRSVSGPEDGYKRELSGLRFEDLSAITLVHGRVERGRFLFRADLLAQDYFSLLDLLDGEEHRCFALAALLAGSFAQSSYASYVYDETAAAEARRPAEPKEIQEQYIRDRFACDPRWLERLERGKGLPAFVYAYSPGSPVSWGESQIPSGVSRRIEPNREYETRAGGAGLPYLVEGFSHPEQKHVWLAAERGIIEFSLPSSQYQPSDYDLVLLAEGRRSQETGRAQHGTIAVNGVVIAYLRVPEIVSELRVQLPRKLMGNSTLTRIELIPDHAEPVFDAQGSTIDQRRLSLRLLSLTVFNTSQEHPRELLTDHRYDCGVEGDAAGILVEGFYRPEPAFTWIAGTRANIHFHLDRVPAQPVLYLGVIARLSMEKRNPQRLQLHLNGTDLGRFDLDEGMAELRIPINRTVIESGSIQIALSLAHAEAVYDENHEIIDSRLLGLAVASVGIFEEARTLVPAKRSVSGFRLPWRK